VNGGWFILLALLIDTRKQPNAQDIKFDGLRLGNQAAGRTLGSYG